MAKKSEGRPRKVKESQRRQERPSKKDGKKAGQGKKE